MTECLGMTETRVLLTFFYGVFWALALNAAGKFKPYATHKIRKLRFYDKAFRRMLVSIGIMNALPLIAFVLWYKYAFSDNLGDGWLAILAPATASITVFGYNRMLAGVIFSDKTYKCFYDEDEWRSIKDCNEDYKPNNFGSHFWPGLLWLIILAVVSLIFRFIP